MTDPRIVQYKRAAENMARGHFHVRVDAPGQGDDLDELGAALVRLGEALDQRFEELRKLTSMTDKINAGLLLDEVLDYVYEEFSDLIPYQRIGCSLLEDHQTVVRARWARSTSPDMQITRGYSAPLKGSSLETIIRTGEPRIINDLEQYLAHKPESASTVRIVKEGMRSSLTCPLIALNKPVGFLFFSSTATNTYQDVHVDVFQRIAGQLSVIIEKGRLYQGLLELNNLKTKFLGMAAHDLRNPLCVIRSYLEIMRMDPGTNLAADYPKMIEAMSTSCDTMLNIIDTFLDISAIESGQLRLKMEKAELASFLHDMEFSARILAGPKGIRLRIEQDPAVTHAVFDAYRIRQVLDNLVSNAIKYSPAGSEVVVRCGRKEGKLAIAVTDHGVGIPEEEIPALFTEYGRTSTNPTAGEPSIGLGLAICRRIVDLHGGVISVETAVGNGSTFTVLLP